MKIVSTRCMKNYFHVSIKADNKKTKVPDSHPKKTDFKAFYTLQSLSTPVLFIENNSGDYSLKSLYC